MCAAPPIKSLPDDWITTSCGVVALTAIINYEIIPYNLIFLAVYSSLSNLTHPPLFPFPPCTSRASPRDPTHYVHVLNHAGRFMGRTQALGGETKPTTHLHANNSREGAQRARTPILRVESAGDVARDASWGIHRAEYHIKMAFNVPDTDRIRQRLSLGEIS
ncbi:hypothetical protein HYPSUDRAFT_216615 [Hypholoma sublateritium FD-334 SS-4]|uniref:Uncharacterized protein n=1 Tax=Hypholoma sublateritium (strain FD-334 SS-4) TaxID=945553 RepID=A0A0D2L2H4_HYPSF|nr:hypothetical protein HYPSUDRAFT_216615 [Hypholoma sublateritium FD-334 SS-4]